MRIGLNTSIYQIHYTKVSSNFALHTDWCRLHLLGVGTAIFCFFPYSVTLLNLKR